MEFSSFFKNKVILVIGGTGSIGSEIVHQLLKYNPKTIRIFSNSENELWETKLKFREYSKNLRFLLGDIRNLERVNRAIEEVDYVFNAAAIKHVSFSEYNPMEAIDVNIHGLDNIIKSCFNCNVKKLIHISTDKAVLPTTVMGATKMLGERLCISREMAKGTKSTIISCVRFGNVLGSRGSIIPLIKEQIRNGSSVTLTNEKMRRFFMSIYDAGKLVLKSMMVAQGGEIFVLKMRTVIIKDLIEVLIDECAPIINKDPNSIKIETIGIRLGEKLDEKLISNVEFLSCYEIDDMYIIYPQIGFEYDERSYEMANNRKKVELDNFYYSTKSQKPLSKPEVREILRINNLI